MAEIAQTFSIDPYAAERSKIARQQKFAELLQSQALQPNEKFSYAGIEAPISAAGGLAKALQAGMSGYLQGDAARKEDAANIKQETDYNAANEAFIRGMSAKPWQNPDAQIELFPPDPNSADPQDNVKNPVYGQPGMIQDLSGEPVPVAPAGGLEGATEALAGMQGNPYAGRLSQQLVMRKLEQDTAAQLAAAERAAQFTNAVRLKQTPGAEPTPPDMQGYQYDVKNNGFKGSLADWKLSQQRPVAPLKDDTFDRENKLRDEFTKQSGDFNKVRDSYAKIIKAAETPSAAGDLSLIFNYMKMLDPGSTVREGEFATAQNAAGIDTQILNMYNKVISGERLSQAQRADFVGTSGRVFDSHRGTQSSLVDTYTGLANKYKLNPENVVRDMAEGMPNGGRTIRINTDEEWAKLPSGALFIGPDGNTRRKP